MIYPALRWLLVIALVVPSLVPAGYMLQRNEQTNVVEMTICPGVHHHENQLTSKTGLTLDARPQSSSEATPEPEICPFAVAGTANLETPENLISSTPERTFTAETLLTRTDSLVPEQLNARGPPLTS